MATIKQILDELKSYENKFKNLGFPLHIDPNCQTNEPTKHPRYRLKKKAWEPQWVFNIRQDKKNKIHGFYFQVIPQIYLCDPSSFMPFGPKEKFFIMHPIYAEMIQNECSDFLSIIT